MIYCSRGFGAQYPIKIMWNAGSTISPINLESAEKLKLSGNKIIVDVTKVGGSTKTIDSYSCKIFLHDKGNRVIPIEVLGIENYIHRCL